MQKTPTTHLKHLIPFIKPIILLTLTLTPILKATEEKKDLEEEQQDELQLQVGNQLYSLPIHSLPQNTPLMTLAEIQEKNKPIKITCTTTNIFNYVVHWLNYKKVAFSCAADAINCYEVAKYLILNKLQYYIYQQIKSFFFDDRQAKSWLINNSDKFDDKHQKDQLAHEEHRKLKIDSHKSRLNPKTKYYYISVKIQQPDTKKTYSKLNIQELSDDKGQRTHQKTLFEYYNSKHHFNLLYAWTSKAHFPGEAWYIYNIDKQQTIGHKIINNREASLSKFKFIEKAGNNCICAPNNHDSFSIFKIDTGEELLPPYKTKEKCFKKLNEIK